MTLLSVSHHQRLDETNGGVTRADQIAEEIHDGHEHIRRDGRAECHIAELLDLISPRLIKRESSEKGLKQCNEDAESAVIFADVDIIATLQLEFGVSREGLTFRHFKGSVDLVRATERPWVVVRPRDIS
jgi:hypothetical protein